MAKSSKKFNTNKKPKKNGDKRFKGIKGVEGMADVSPKNTDLWRTVWDVGNKIAKFHHFHYVETPVVERAELFERALERDFDFSEKKLFTFKSGTRTKMVLRPEGSVSVMRSYLENQLGYFSLPLKAYYSGPVFRKNGRGEKCQFREWGFQIIGDNDPVYDAQVVLAILDLLNDLKITNPVLKVNTVGCRVCRPGFQEKLKNYCDFNKNKICGECRERCEQDPVTVFRCWRDKCLDVRDNAPNILDHLCQNCNSHFQKVLALIEDNGVDYVSDPYLFGNKNYYNKFVFEVYPDENLEIPIASGGRQDYLAERIGGRQLPSVSGEIYLDNLIDYLLKTNIKTKEEKGKKDELFFVAVGEEAKNSSLEIIHKFRKKGVVVVECLGRKTFKSQMKAAEKSGVGLVLIYGQKEVFEGTAVMRELDTGIQETVPLEDMVEKIKSRLKKIKKRSHC
jgi:histidyl-tRNA synthetase